MYCIKQGKSSYAYSNNNKKKIAPVRESKVEIQCVHLGEGS